MAARAMIVFALLGADHVFGFRLGRRERRQQHTSSSSSPGFVAKLYTYGAPQTGSPALQNPRTADGCFPGARFVAQNNWFVDFVPEQAARFPFSLLKFKHPRMEFVTLDSKKGISTVSCQDGNSVKNRRKTTWALHRRKYYLPLSSTINQEMKEVGELGLKNSAESDVDEVAKRVLEYGGGWSLIGSAAHSSGLAADDVSHLMWNRETGACILTFEGTDDLGDWWSDANAVKVSFCGLKQKVHKGFTQELKSVVGHSEWQQKIRARLGQCGEVRVTGMSLGGAVASLFSACANNPNAGEEYGLIGWSTR